MRAHWIVLLAAVVGAPRTARAYSSHKDHAARGGYCDPATEVLGRSACARFGRWGSPPGQPALVFDAELAARHWLVPLALGPVGNRAALAFGPRLRALAVFRWLHVGVELDTLDAATGPTITRDGEGGAATGEPVGQLALRAVVGAHARFGPVTAGAEVAGGGDLALYAPSCGGKCPSVTELGLAVEGRVRAEVWLSPHLTVGSSLGIDARDARDFTVTIGFGFHVRAWDGQ